MVSRCPQDISCSYKESDLKGFRHIALVAALTGEMYLALIEV